MIFSEFRDKLAESFARVMANGNDLFETDADSAELWELYLDSFPPGTNPMYRKRREYDCSCSMGKGCLIFY